MRSLQKYNLQQAFDKSQGVGEFCRFNKIFKEINVQTYFFRQRTLQDSCSEACLYL